jgi:hypothetical protein
VSIAKESLPIERTDSDGSRGGSDSLKTDAVFFEDYGKAL